MEGATLPRAARGRQSQQPKCTFRRGTGSNHPYLFQAVHKGGIRHHNTRNGTIDHNNTKLDLRPLHPLASASGEEQVRISRLPKTKARWKWRGKKNVSIVCILYYHLSASTICTD